MAVPDDTEENGADAGISPTGEVDVQALYARLRDEVARSGAAPYATHVDGPLERRAARDAAERLWPVSADRGLRLRPGFRGGLGTPLKVVLRKLMRWYVEPLAYDQRAFNAATLRLLDDLQEQVDRLDAEVRELRGRA